MLSARSIFHEIRSSDRAYQLLLSVAAKGETQGGWENERIALLTRDHKGCAKTNRSATRTLSAISRTAA